MGSGIVLVPGMDAGVQWSAVALAHAHPFPFPFPFPSRLSPLVSILLNTTTHLHNIGLRSGPAVDNVVSGKTIAATELFFVFKE